MQAQQQQTELPDWQRRLRERLLSKRSSAPTDPLLSEVSAEEALTALRDILHREVTRYGRWLSTKNRLGFVLMVLVVILMAGCNYGLIVRSEPWLLDLLFVFICVMFGIYGVLNLLARRLSILWRRIVPSLAEVLPQVTSGVGLSPLIDFVGWFRIFESIFENYSAMQHLARKTMTQLLGRVSTEEAKALTENNRLVLLQLAQKAEDEVDMGVVALLTLGMMDEVRVRPVAQKLTTSFLPRVREAAKECLGQLSG